MSKATSKIVIAAFALASAMGPALAADLDIVEANPVVTPVEFGSGWYLRGDIGWNFKVDSNLSYYSNAQYDYDDQNMDGGTDFSVGFGYVFNDWFRSDVTLDYADQNKWSGRTQGSCGSTYSGNCYSLDSARFDMFSVQANGYVNLGRFYGWSPYVGGGLGVSKVNWNDYESTPACSMNSGQTCPYGSYAGTSGIERVQGTAVSYPGAYSTLFSYSLMAGVDYKIDDRWYLDLGYKWTQTHGDGKVVEANANGAGNPVGDSTFGTLNVHQFKIGLRYEIW